MPCLFLVFKKAIQSQVEGLVSWVAGPRIHVELVPGNQNVAFTAFMWENFSVNEWGDRFTRATHDTLSLQVSQEDHDRVCNFMTRQVARRVPYNYGDVLRCMLPERTVAHCEDVASEAAITSLYCSQAVVLALRFSLEDEGTAALRESLAALNSRLTTPQALYDAVAPHAEPADTFIAREF
jgi:hypothetical protein